MTDERISQAAVPILETVLGTEDSGWSQEPEDSGQPDIVLTERYKLINKTRLLWETRFVYTIENGRRKSCLPMVLKGNTKNK